MNLAPSQSALLILAILGYLFVAVEGKTMIATHIVKLLLKKKKNVMNVISALLFACS